MTNVLLAALVVSHVALIALIGLALARLGRLEAHVIELKTWHISTKLQERRDANELEELRVRVGSFHGDGGLHRYAQPGSGTIQ